MPTNSIPIALDKERHIRFSFNALCLLEDTLGLPISDIGEALGGAVKLSTIRALLYAGLSDEDPAMTLRQAGALIETGRLTEIADAIRRAFEAAFAREDDEPKKAAGAKPKPGTGKSI